MQLVEVFPLKKGIRLEEVSYFFSEPLERGQVVTIPFGTQKIAAAVKKCSNASDHKSKIRQADYELKKIIQTEPASYSALFVDACVAYARKSASTPGSIIRSFSPRFHTNNKQNNATDNESKPKKASTQTLQCNQQTSIEKITTFQKANSSQTFFIAVPTDAAGTFLKNKFPESAYFHSSHAQANLKKRVKSAQKTSPDIIIATPQFFSLFTNTIDALCVFDEGNNNYKMNARPFADGRDFLRTASRTFNIPLLQIDQLPRPETKALSDVELIPAPDPKNRQLIDMKGLDEKQNKNGVTVFSPPAAKIIRDTKKENNHTFLFVARKGRKPFSVCGDCGETLSCPRCELPLALTDTANGRRFLCRTCGFSTSSLETCQNCGSWDLKALGIGLDFIKEIIDKNVEDTPTFTLTGDDKNPQAVLEKFFAAPSGLLLSTTMGINWLRGSVDNSIIITADSLVAIPDISVSHQLTRDLLKLRSYTTNAFIMQSRASDTSIFEIIRDGNSNKFYEKELSLREQFGYPPFQVLTKLSTDKDKAEFKKVIADTFADFSPHVYPARDKSGWHALLKVKAHNWPSDELHDRLLSLPLSISININPTRLL